MKRSLAGSYSCGYCLSLGDGSTWWITGDKESARWIDKLAIIMGLQECTLNDSPKLIFSRIENTDYARDELSHIAFPHLHSRDYSKGWACFEYKSIRIWHHNSIPHVICELTDNEGVNEYVNMCFSLHPIYQKSVHGGAVPFHAALIEFEGRGVLLAAPGDTGKTTCCQRLPDHWQPLSDDQALVVQINQADTGYTRYRPGVITSLGGKRIRGTFSIPCHSKGYSFLSRLNSMRLSRSGQGKRPSL